MDKKWEEITLRYLGFILRSVQRYSNQTPSDSNWPGHQALRSRSVNIIISICSNEIITAKTEEEKRWSWTTPIPGHGGVDLFHFGILHSQLHLCKTLRSLARPRKPGIWPSSEPPFSRLWPIESQQSATTNSWPIGMKPPWNPTSLCLSHENSWVNDPIKVNDYSTWLMKSH